jgi:hypothetical protein
LGGTSSIDDATLVGGLADSEQQIAKDEQDIVPVGTGLNEPELAGVGEETAADAFTTALQDAALGVADTVPQDLSVTVQLQDSAVAVLMRHPALTQSASNELLSAVRSQLSWQGMTLSSLKINGQAVWNEGNEVPHAPQATAADLGGDPTVLEIDHGS